MNKLVRFKLPYRNLKWLFYGFLYPDKQYLDFNRQVCHLQWPLIPLLDFIMLAVAYRFCVTLNPNDINLVCDHLKLTMLF
jgi:hypothetical protein